MFDVITIGSATIDVFANTVSQVIKIITENKESDFIAYPSGSKILISDLQFLIGGGGSNTAVSFSRLGLNTGFIGKIGNDENAKKVLSLLDIEHIEFLGGRDGQTGYSIVLDSVEHDRSILAFKGSNNNLLESDIDFEKLRSKWIYASSMVEQSYETLKYVIKKGKENGCKIAFNPSNYQAKMGKIAMHDVLENVDALILNKEEAQLLLEVENEACDVLARKLSKDDITYVVITDGKKGATCFSNGCIYKLFPGGKSVAVETTGAGDAFASGFIAGLAYELLIEEAMLLGQVQASSVIASPGAKTGLLTKHEAFVKLKDFDGKVDIEDMKNHETHKLPQFFIADKGKDFVLCNGIHIEDVKDLAAELRIMDNGVFEFHKKNNDFGRWLKDVFGFDTLAYIIESMSSKKDVADAIYEYVHRIHYLK